MWVGYSKNIEKSRAAFQTQKENEKSQDFHKTQDFCNSMILPCWCNTLMLSRILVIITQVCTFILSFIIYSSSWMIKSLIGQFSVSVVSWIISTRLLAVLRSILRTGAITKWRNTKDWPIPAPKKVNQQILYYVDWRSHFFSNPLLRSIVRLLQVISFHFIFVMALKEPLHKV